MAENLNQKIEQIIQTPDRGLDKPQFESQVGTASERVVSERTPVQVPVGNAPVQTQAPTSLMSPMEMRAKEIEKVLEEDMADVYFTLNPNDQAKFKVTGEKTAREINSLLSEVKIQINKIADLIRGWLKVLPGVSKFFIEQETKIKTDKLLDQYNKK